MGGKHIKKRRVISVFETDFEEFERLKEELQVKSKVPHIEIKKFLT